MQGSYFRNCQLHLRGLRLPIWAEHNKRVAIKGLVRSIASKLKSIQAPTLMETLTDYPRGLNGDIAVVEYRGVSDWIEY